MTSYRGAALVAIDVNLPILWDINKNPINSTSVYAVRQQTLVGIIGHAKQVHVRIPFNPTMNQNQLETLLDVILGLGFTYRNTVSSNYGPYSETWIFGL